MRICICGGGALGHVCAGVLSSLNDIEVNILTSKPMLWSKKMMVTDKDGKVFNGTINTVSDNPELVIPGSDIVFLCLPGYAIENILIKIKDFLDENSIVGSVVCSTGFFFFAHKILGDDSKLFGFQRTPFIARVNEYGHSANLLGYKKDIAIATENIIDRERFRRVVENLWITPTILLDSHFEVSLTNSNPILHTGRLYSMFSLYENYQDRILFYDDWTDDSSQLVIDMDKEFFKILSSLEVETLSIKPLLEYYESSDAKSLTNKIKSIEAFKGLLAPMVNQNGKWYPDYSNRYFTEDFPFGLRFIYDLGVKHNIDMPNISKVFLWGLNQISRSGN